MPEYMGETRVLIIDDDQAVADTLGQILSVHGYDVRITYSAESAIDIIADWRPDIAVVDVLLPRMNGIEFGLLLKETYTGCQVLLFSGAPGVDDLLRKAGSEGQQFEILAKPVHPTVMLDAISILLSRKDPGYDQADWLTRAIRD
jgi:DNA-binding response OmpR family regulator